MEEKVETANKASVLEEKLKEAVQNSVGAGIDSFVLVSMDTKGKCTIQIEGSALDLAFMKTALDSFVLHRMMEPRN